METDIKKCGECNSTKIHSRGLVNRLGSTYRRYICQECGTNTYFIESKDGKKKQPVERFKLKQEDIKHVESNFERYVITSIQNNTPTHEAFKESLLRYCKVKDAKLIIIPVRYRNPDSFHAGVQDTYWWDTELTPYFVESEINLTSNIKVLGDYFANATTPNPINGLERIVRGKSVIIGHGTLQMKTAPRLADEHPAIITSTGSISVDNYSESRAGYHSRNRHTNGAVVVEVDPESDIFHLRHLIASSDGSFYDIDGQYTPEGIYPLEGIAGLVTGDEHAWFADDEVKDATYLGEESIVNVLKPAYVCRHDLFDGYSINHHHEGKFFQQYNKHVTGKNDLAQELLDTAHFIIDTTDNRDFTNIIISSNHNSFLMRWLENNKSSQDVENALIHSVLREMVLRAVLDGVADIDPFNLWLKDYMKDYPDVAIEFTDRINSFKIRGVEVSMHGDIGANGAKGSKNAFSKMSTPVIVGHSHSPCIEGNCFQVGTSSLMNLEYNKGLSSWMHTHAVVYPSGQVQLINIIRGKWKL